jgi:hypothetical protein
VVVLWIVLAVILVVAVYLLSRVLPDVSRYRRLRKM